MEREVNLSGRKEGRNDRILKHKSSFKRAVFSQGKKESSSLKLSRIVPSAEESGQ